MLLKNQGAVRDKDAQITTPQERNTEVCHDLRAFVDASHMAGYSVSEGSMTKLGSLASLGKAIIEESRH